MNLLIKITIPFFALILASSFHSPDPAELIDNMIEKNKHVNTLKVNTFIKERIQGRIIEKQNNFIIQANPFKIYFTEKKFGIDIEGLYIAGANNNNAIVATRGFPWIKLDLDPLGSRMRNETHHTIFEAGFSYFIGVLEGFKTEYGSKYPSMLTYQGLYQKGSVFFYKIMIENPNFRYVEYTVKKGENLHTIAGKFHVNDYMILEKNNLGFYNDVKEGQKILIPNDYAKKIILHIDRSSSLPLYLEVHDDVGLYSSYTFTNIAVNPKLDDLTFDPSNPNYHFQ